MVVAIRRLIASGLIACTLPLAALAAPAADRQLQAGDEVEVMILNNPEALSGYTQRFVLGTEGVISLPLAGRITVIGKTPGQLADQLQAAYKRLFAFAFVGVQLVKAKASSQPSAIFVVGQLRTVGPQPVPTDATYTIVDALGHAGGPSETADLSKVTIYRASGKTEEIDLQQRLQDGSALHVALHPGDTVYVPSSWLVRFNQYSPLIQTGLTVVGAVAVILNLVNLIKGAPSP